MNKPTNTTKRAESAERTLGTAPAAGVPVGPATPARPGPWDAPWHRKEDAAGWETVYRGTGQRRPSKSIVELELTPEQDEWLDGAAEATGLTLHQFLRKLIEDARRTALAEQPRRDAADAAG